MSQPLTDSVLSRLRTAAEAVAMTLYFEEASSP
jgi:hypothetical protein